MMSKLPFTHTTAVRALRGLALGTSCSLILISEERRRRLDFVRTLADNGRLLKSQPGYVPGGATTRLMELESSAADRSSMDWGEAVFDDILPRTGRPRGIDEPFEGNLQPPLRGTPIWNLRPSGEQLIPAEYTLRNTIRGPAALGETELARKYPMEPVDTRIEVPASIMKSTVRDVPAPETVDTLSQVPEIESDGVSPLDQFKREYHALDLRNALPESFLANARALLQRCEEMGDSRTAQEVVDLLATCHPINHHDLAGTDPMFLLRAILQDFSSPGARRTRPAARFRPAVHLFWHIHKGCDAYGGFSHTTELLDLLADTFSQPNAGDDIKAFLTTAQLQLGRHMTSHVIVTPIAEMYHRRGDAESLKRLRILAEKANAPLQASALGRALVRGWEDKELADGRRAPQEQDGPIGALKQDVERTRARMEADMSPQQRDLYVQMRELVRQGAWDSVIHRYADIVGTKIGISQGSLWLAVEASVEAEGIHSQTAVDCIEQAHKLDVDVDFITQKLLMARFTAIGDQVKAVPPRLRNGAAHRAIYELLDRVAPFYPRPSQTVYNRAIRTCIRAEEFRETKILCQHLADDWWNGDPLRLVYNFANLSMAAVQTRDYMLLQKLLEDLPWRPYTAHPVCKKALKDARYWLRKYVNEARSEEERRRHDDALGRVEISYQNVLRTRTAIHVEVKKRFKAEGFAAMMPEGFRPRKRGDRPQHKKSWGEEVRMENRENKETEAKTYHISTYPEEEHQGASRLHEYA